VPFNPRTRTVWTWLATSLAHQGAFEEAIRTCEQAARLVEEAGGLPNRLDAQTQLHAHLGLGRVYLLQGEFRRAIPILDRVLKSFPPELLGPLSRLAPSAMGYALARSGRLKEGLAHLEQAAGGVAAGQLVADGPLQLTWLGEAYLLASRSQDAAEAARRAMALAQEQGTRGLEAYALRLLAELAAHSDPPEAEQAEGYYCQALARAEELGMRPLVAHCHLGLGTLYQKVGRDEAARAELAAAAELYRAMEMPFWLEKAEAVLVQVVS